MHCRHVLTVPGHHWTAYVSWLLGSLTSFAYFVHIAKSLDGFSGVRGFITMVYISLSTYKLRCSERELGRPEVKFPTATLWHCQDLFCIRASEQRFRLFYSHKPTVSSLCYVLTSINSSICATVKNVRGFISYYSTLIDPASSHFLVLLDMCTFAESVSCRGPGT